MRAPRVKFPAMDREEGRRAPEQTAHERVRSAEADVCLLPASSADSIKPDPSRLKPARRCVGEVILAPTPIRVASLGEHHILSAHEAQARRLALGSFFRRGRHAAPSPRRTPVHQLVRRATRYDRSTAPAGSTPCSL